MTRLLVLLLVVAAGAAAPAGGPVPGSYCPLPEPGQQPDCLAPARAEFEGFFGAVEAGDLDEAKLAQLEGAVARGAAGAKPYLALSSLAYGYYRLSERAARAGDADPAIAARLERWNDLFARAYAESEAREYRLAVREAAADLQHRAPPVRLRCRDARGETSPCDSTDAVVRGLDAAAGDVGFGGGLRRLLERIFGPGPS